MTDPLPLRQDAYLTNHPAPPETDTDTVLLTVTENGIVDPGCAGRTTVHRFFGVDADGENILFAVDHRLSHGLIDFILNEGEITVSVEGWQIIGKGAF